MAKLQGAKIGDYHTLTDWGLYLKVGSPKISDAEVDEYLVKVPGSDTLQETNCFINLSCGRGIEISVAVAGNGDAILPQLVDKFAKLGSTQP